MNDIDIFKLFGQHLFNIAPEEDKDVELLISIAKGVPEITVWQSKNGKSEKTFRYSDEVCYEFGRLVKSLHKYFLDNNMGEWNVFSL